MKNDLKLNIHQTSLSLISLSNSPSRRIEILLMLSTYFILNEFFEYSFHIILFKHFLAKYDKIHPYHCELLNIYSWLIIFQRTSVLDIKAQIVHSNSVNLVLVSPLNRGIGENDAPNSPSSTF